MFDPELQLFTDLSDVGLEELQLAAQNDAAHLRKSIVRELQMWVEKEALAAQALWIRNRRKDLNSKEKRDVTVNADGLLPRSRDGGKNGS